MFPFTPESSACIPYGCLPSWYHTGPLTGLISRLSKYFPATLNAGAWHKMAVSLNRTLFCFNLTKLKAFMREHLISLKQMQNVFSKSAAAAVLAVRLNHSLWSLGRTSGCVLYPVGNIFQRWKGSEEPNISSRALLDKQMSLFPILQTQHLRDLKEHNLLKTWCRHNKDN